MHHLHCLLYGYLPIYCTWKVRSINFFTCHVWAWILISQSLMWHVTDLVCVCVWNCLHHWLPILNIPFQWFGLLRHICEVLCSDLSSQTGCPDSLWFFSVHFRLTHDYLLPLCFPVIWEILGSDSSVDESSEVLQTVLGTLVNSYWSWRDLLSPRSGSPCWSTLTWRWRHQAVHRGQ